MNIFQFLLLAFLLALPFAAVRTQLTYAPVLPDKDQKPTYYQSNAKEKLKAGAASSSALFAVEGLYLATKKRQYRITQSVMGEAIPLAMQQIQQQLDSEGTTPEFVDDETIYRHRKLLMDLAVFMEMKKRYETLPAEKLITKGKKALQLQFDLPDFQSEFAQAEAAFPGLLQQGADRHFALAAALATDADWRRQYRRAKHLEKVLEYVPEYPEAQGALRDARSRGVCIMAIGSIQNDSRQGTIEAQKIRNGIGFKTKKVKAYPYFKLLGTGNQANANVAFTAVIDHISIEKKEDDPYTEEHQKEIDEKVVKATSTHYSKSAYLTIEGTYAIHDMTTGELLHSEPFKSGANWRHSWAVIRGNRDVVKKRTINKAKRKNKPYPTVQELIDGGGENNLSFVFATAIADFAAQYP